MAYVLCISMKLFRRRRVILNTFWTLPMICTRQVISGYFLAIATQFTANSIPNSRGPLLLLFDFGTEKNETKKKKNEAQTFRQSSRIRIMEFDQKEQKARVA